jgi:hypothetical protein
MPPTFRPAVPFWKTRNTAWNVQSNDDDDGAKVQSFGTTSRHSDRTFVINEESKTRRAATSSCYREQQGETP